MTATTITFFGVPEWSEQGPGPIVDGNATFIGTGAIVALATHPTQAGTVYAATSGGGVWRSWDAVVGTVTPGWQPLTDQYSSSALGAIIMSQRDLSTVYAGTGTFASFPPTGGAVGLYRSSDGGTTWEVTGATILNGTAIRSLATTSVPGIDKEALLVATLDWNPQGTVLASGGILRSEDGGTTLTMLSAASTSGLPAGEGWSLASDLARPGWVYAAISLPQPAGSAIYRSGDGGKTWTATVAGVDARRLAAANWIRLTVANGTVYAGLVNPSVDPTGSVIGSQLVGLFSATSGATAEQWSEIPLPKGSSNTVNPLNFGKYKFAMVAAAGSLYVGGDEGGIWRCDLSDPSAPRWEQLSRYDGTPGDTVPSDSDSLSKLTPHDDCQHLEIDAAGDLIAANDGGVYRLVNPARQPHRGTRQWYAIGTTMRNNEAFSVGYDTLNRIAIAGTADNGSAEQKHPGSHTWLQVLDGDGGGQAVDNNDPGVTHRYAMGNTYGAGLLDIVRRSFDHSNTLTKTETLVLAKPETPDVKGSALTVGGDASHAGIFALNNLQGEGLRLLLGSQGLYESTDGGATASAISLNDPSGTAHSTSITAGKRTITYGAMQDGAPKHDVAYVGLLDGTLWLRQPGGSFQQVTSYPGNGIAIQQVVMDVQDWRRAYVIDTTHVRLTVDGGASANWIDCTGNLLAIAADAQGGAQLSAIRVIPNPSGGEAVLVGAAGGVFRSLNAQNGPGATWTRFGRNLPNTYGQDIQYYPSTSRRNGPAGDVMVASLYGRGVWLLEQASRDLFSTAEMQILSPAGPNTIRLELNRNVPSLLDVFDHDGSPVPTATVPLTALSRITIVCHGQGNRLILDCSNGLILVPNGIDFNADPGQGSALEFSGGRADQQRIILGQGSRGNVIIDGMVVRYAGIGSIESGIITQRTVIEASPEPATCMLANGSPIDGVQSLAFIEAIGASRFTVTVTRSTAVAVDLRRGSGRLDVDGLWGTPQGLRGLTVLTGHDAQDVRITTTPQGVPMEIHGSGGRGSVAIGSTTGSGGSLAAVKGPIHMSNAGGGTLLSVSAAVDPTSTTAVLTNGSLSGLGPAAISFAPGDLAGLTVIGSGEGTTYTVEDTIPALTALLGGGSINSLQVHGSTGPLDYTTGNGVDYVTLGAPSPGGNSRVAPIRGPVTIRCAAQGNVNVTVDDSGENVAKDVVLTDNGITGLTTAAITLVASANPYLNGLVLKSGRSRVYYSVVNTPPMFTVSVQGQGPDIINAAATRQSLRVQGATDVTLGNSLTGLTLIHADVHIAANPGGTTQFTLDDRGNPHPESVEIDGTTVRGLSAALVDFSAATLRGLSVLCGNGGDRLHISDTPLSCTTFLNLGVTPDHVDVLATSGPLVINAQAGTLHKVIVGSTAPDFQKDDLARHQRLDKD